jgi:SAM-dependent methyltransferase
MKKLYKFLLNTLPRPLLIRMSYVFTKLAPILYRGNKYECPVCGKTSRKFLSYGSAVSHRENVLCPHDLTLERHRLIWLFLQRKSNLFSAEKLSFLHIAPEQCFLPYFKKQKNLDYLTGDIVSPIADIHFDLHDIPLEDNRFDVIFCNHVLEHVNDSKQCMSELYRVMKPGGWGIFQVPQDMNRADTYEDWNITSEADREQHFWQKDHVRLFGRNYPEKLAEVGFEYDAYTASDLVGADFVDRFRLSEGEILYVFRKKNRHKK